MKREIPTQEMLKNRLSYDPETGVFTWRIGFRTGTDAGYLQPSGYRAIHFGGVPHRCHRLAWLYMTGEFPKGHIDHINGVKDDNRFSNLRDVSPAINGQNIRGPHRTNKKTGYLGVTPANSKFMACLSVKNKTKYLGVYATPEEAHNAYLTAKRQLHEGCTI